MSNTMHLVDGSTVEIPEHRIMKFMQNMTHRGIKSLRFDDTIVVLSPSNIIKIVMEGEEDGTDNRQSIPEGNDKSRDVASEVEGDVTEGTREGGYTITGEREEVEAVPEPEVKKETKQERDNRILEVMKQKSDCAGNKHVGQEQIIHYQDVTINRKGAKGKGLPSRRYFPICTFCGLKQRYVKADSLTDEQKENAKSWTGVE